jgi:uncharacterized membrane protein
VKQHKIPFLIFLLSFSLSLGLSLKAYALGNLRLFNSGILHNLIWNTVHGNFLYCPVTRICHLGDHFSPLLLLITPFYFFFQHSLFFPFLMAFLFGMATLGMYYFFQAAGGNRETSALWAMAFTIYPSLVSNFWRGMEDVHLSLPCSAFLLYFLEKKNYRAAYVSAFFLFMVKEEFFLVGFFLGLFLIIFHKKKTDGIVIALLSLVLFMVLKFCIMPALSQNSWLNIFKYPYGHIGKNLTDMLHHLPERYHYLFIPPSFKEKIWNIFCALSLVIFLPLVRPRFLFIVFPIFMLNYITVWSYTFSPYDYHWISMVPFLFASAFYGFQAVPQKYRKLALVALFLMIMIVDWQVYGDRYKDNSYTSNRALTEQVVATIPPGASCVVDDCTGGYDVVKRKNVQLLRFFYARPDLFGDYEYVIVNMRFLKDGLPPPISQEEQGFLDEIVKKGQYKIVFYKDDLIVLKRK